MAKRRMSGIADSEIVSQLELLQGLEAKTRNYFHLDSPLWKAIVEYIRNAKVDECVLCEKPHPVQIYRGTGPGISYRRAYVKPAGADDPLNTVRIVFDVDFYDDEEDRTVSNRHVMVDVPIHLMSDFTQDKFDAWIDGKVADWKKKSEAAKYKVILGLARNNPDLLRKVQKAIREGKHD